MVRDITLYCILHCYNVSSSLLVNNAFCTNIVSNTCFIFYSIYYMIELVMYYCYWVHVKSERMSLHHKHKA